MSDKPMTRDDLEVGKVYLLAGCGELLLAEVPVGVPGLRFLQHGGTTYWASIEQVVREASPKDVARREANARARGVGCGDPECWCRKRGRGGTTLGQEVYTIIQAAPEGVSYPQIAARLYSNTPKAALEEVLSRLERQGYIRVEGSDVSRTFLAPGPVAVVRGAL